MATKETLTFIVLVDGNQNICAQKDLGSNSMGVKKQIELHFILDYLD